MKQTPLTPKERYQLEKLVEQKRNMYDLGMGSIGDGILQLVERLDIGILYLPKNTDTDEEPLSAMYLSSKENGGKIMSFIGVNTAQFYDTQLFAITHELYHHWEQKNNFRICRNMEEADGLRELRANQFAASFLLPSKTLEKEIMEKNNYELNMDKWDLRAILRFIVRIHLNYKLPYKSIVERLTEVGALTDEKVLKFLWSQNTRDKSSMYYKIGMSYDADVFMLLNKKTYKIGADSRLLETILQNYEMSAIGIDELAEDLSVFGKELGDVGLGKKMKEIQWRN